MQQDWLDLASLGPMFTADPYPVYTSLRDRAPIHRVVYHGLPSWLVLGHKEARQLIADRHLSLDPANASETAQAVPWANPRIFGHAKGLLSSDPPDHTRLRRLVNKAFTPRQVDTLRPRVREVADGLVSAFVGRGQADLIEDFGAQLPAIVIMELLGVPAGDRREFGASCDLFLTSDPGKLPLLPAAVASIISYIEGLVEAKRRQPGDDLLSQIILARDHGDQLGELELRTLAFLLLLAGLETTVSLIGNGPLALLRHPGQMAALRADPGLLAPAIEEMLRYDSPVAAVKLRYATEEITVGDAVMSRGDPVVICLGAASRDPERYPDPGTFDISRADPGHLGFGYGIHFRLGAPLARMEAQIAFETLLSRCDNLALACDPADLSWRISPVIRSLSRLPVTFTAA